MDIVQHLGKEHYDILLVLQLVDCHIGQNATAALAQHICRDLQVLDLSNNKLSQQAMQGLVKGDWPLLFALDLSKNCMLNAQAISQLRLTNWTALHSLCLSYVPFSPAMMQQLVQISLPKLSTLVLEFCRLGTSAIAELASAVWPDLATLQLSHNDMGAGAALALQLTPLSKLSCLDVSSCGLDADGMQHLVQAEWSHLTELNIASNRLDAEAISRLITAEWKDFDRLNLAGQMLHLDAMEHLLMGNWPELTCLMLDWSCVDDDAVAALLGSHKDREMLAARISYPRHLHLDFDQPGVERLHSNVLQWPKLTSILLGLSNPQDNKHFWNPAVRVSCSCRVLRDFIGYIGPG